MTILTYTTHEKVNSASLGDFCLICRTLCNKVICISVEDIDILLRNVNMIEEVTSHERVIAFRMLLRKAYILIHVECNDILERYLTSLIHLDKLLIGSDRSTSGRKSKNERLVSHLCLSLDS